MNQKELPKGSLSVRLTDRGRQRLEKLARIRDASYNQVVSDALIHMLASWERHEQIHGYVPSEQAEAPAGEE
jgi:predicted transcriptional regulator